MNEKFCKKFKIAKINKISNNSGLNQNPKVSDRKPSINEQLLRKLATGLSCFTTQQKVKNSKFKAVIFRAIRDSNRWYWVCEIQYKKISNRDNPNKLIAIET